jgi:uncharacterized membrane protein YdjX (TVP38/TMEM64 family)
VKQVHRRILAATALLITIAVLGFVAQQYSSREWLSDHETRVREFVKMEPVKAWLIGFLIYTSLSLIPGTAGKAIVCGWVYGFWSATILVDGALTVAALITFYASRFLFRETIESHFRVYLEHFRHKCGANVGYYLLMLRLVHTPFSFVNYVAGATNIVSTKTFWWTTQLGLLPANMAFVYVGTQIPSLATIAERGIWALLDARLLVALIAPSILTVVLRQILPK